MGRRCGPRWRIGRTCAPPRDVLKTCLSSGALGATVNPGLNQSAYQLLAARRWFAPSTGLPSPCNQIILCDVFVQHSEIAATVAIFVLELLANLAKRFALPCHRQRRQLPARMPGDALERCGRRYSEITVGVTG